jgi:tight adherence protein C
MSAVPAPLLLLFACSAVLIVSFVAEVIRQLPTDSTARRERLPLAWRAAWPLLLAIGLVIRPMMSVRLFRSFQQRLARAGLDQVIAPQHMIAAQCLAAGLAGSVSLSVGGLGISIPGWTLLVVLAVAIVWPLIWLRESVVRRGESLLRQLPFLIDLLAMSVESGLPLAAALPQAVERLPAGALRDECRRLMRDVKAGMPRDEALRTLAARLELAAVTQFTIAVSAAQRDGGTIIQTLRAHAEQQRNDRFTRAEHRAAQAPVRVLFPLVVFIFPGTLAVVLYPVISRMFSEVARWQ